MCFSASASFSSGIVLSIAGIATLRKASPSLLIAFGAIPFIFAVQQFSEGFVWLSLTNQAFAGWQKVFSFLFLIFAQIVWPVWIPFSLLLIEENKRQKNILYLLQGMGLVLASYYAFCLIIYPVSTRVEGYHIQYLLSYPTFFLTFSSIFYAMVTVLPTFISTVKRMKVLGFFISLSYVATYIFYNEYIISVWCYFAALLSIIIYWILFGLRKTSLTILFQKAQDDPVTSI